MPTTTDPTTEPLRRHGDPPDGSHAERWSAALRPWIPILTVVMAVWGIAATILAVVGFGIITPGETVGLNTARIIAIENQITAERIRADRSEALTMALVRSKCLELDINSQALSVLPCDQVFARQPLAKVAPMSFNGRVVDATTREPIPPPYNKRPREYLLPGGKGWTLGGDDAG